MGKASNLSINIYSFIYRYIQLPATDGCMNTLTLCVYFCSFNYERYISLKLTVHISGKNFFLKIVGEWKWLFLFIYLRFFFLNHRLKRVCYDSHNERKSVLLKYLAKYFTKKPGKVNYISQELFCECPHGMSYAPSSFDN